MRRVFAICLAMMVVSFAVGDVMAQDAEQQFSERLLEILKDRISETEYAELQALSEKMRMENDAVASRLGEIDRSIADYLARDDGIGETGTHFGWTSDDGLFGVGVSGLFQFSYAGVDRDNGQDTNSFDVEENRFSFVGHAFDPNLTFFFEFDAEEVADVTALDAWVNYNYCDWLEIRAGQMKVPFGRQWQIYEGDLAFANRSIVTNFFSPGRDVGLMLHDRVAFGDGDPMFEYQAGVFNGEGLGSDMNDNNWMAWAVRAGVHPFGWVDYVEGDWTGSSEPRVALAAGLFGHKGRPAGMEVDTLAWSADFTVTWMGIYFTAEYYSSSVDISGMSGDIDNDGWMLQAGYMIPNTRFEALARYGAVDHDDDSSIRATREWAIGAAYYFQGHDLKLIAETGGTSVIVHGDDNNFDSPFFIRLAFQLDW